MYRSGPLPLHEDMSWCSLVAEGWL